MRESTYKRTATRESYPPNNLQAPRPAYRREGDKEREREGGREGNESGLRAEPLGIQRISFSRSLCLFLSLAAFDEYVCKSDKKREEPHTTCVEPPDCPRERVGPGRESRLASA